MLNYFFPKNKGLQTVNLDQLIALANEDSLKLKDISSILSNMENTQIKHQRSLEVLNKQLQDKFNDAVIDFSVLKQEFNLSEEDGNKIIQVGDSNIFLKFAYGLNVNAESKYGIRSRLEIIRSDINAIFFIDLCPAEDLKVQNEYRTLEMTLQRKLANRQRGEDIELNTTDLQKIEEYTIYLQNEIDRIRKLDLEDYMFYLFTQQHNKVIESFHLQETVEKALGLARNLK